MFFKKLFFKKKEETPGEMFQRLHPELFDKSGKTYNGGIFEDSSNSIKITENQIELFPDIDNVFESSNIIFIENNFLPLSSIELNAINKNWFGIAHFISYSKSLSNEYELSAYQENEYDYYITIFESKQGKLNYIGNNEEFNRTSDEEIYWDRTKAKYANNKKQYHNNGSFF